MVGVDLAVLIEKQELLSLKLLDASLDTMVRWPCCTSCETSEAALMLAGALCSFVVQPAWIPCLRLHMHQQASRNDTAQSCCQDAEALVRHGALASSQRAQELACLLQPQPTWRPLLFAHCTACALQSSMQASDNARASATPSLPQVAGANSTDDAVYVELNVKDISIRDLQAAPEHAIVLRAHGEQVRYRIIPALIPVQRLCCAL